MSRFMTTLGNLGLLAGQLDAAEKQKEELKRRLKSNVSLILNLHLNMTLQSTIRTKQINVQT